MYRNLLGLSRAASICVRVKNSGDVVRITCAAVECSVIVEAEVVVIEADSYVRFGSGKNEEMYTWGLLLADVSIVTG